jgi:hypothetical protein
LRRRSAPFWLTALVIAVLPTSGCLLHRRAVGEQYSKAPLKVASRQELVDIANQQADAIHSLKATVDIDTSAGGIKKGEITDYKEIRGYILARKPGELHMVGLMPIVRTTAFDMVSNGTEFKLWIPPKNRFVIGLENVPTPDTDKAMENIRPQNFYEALLIQPVNPETELAVLDDNGYEILYDSKGHRILQPDYELIIILKDHNNPRLSRKIVFGRTDLKPHRQYIYGEEGKLVTDSKYANYQDYDGTSYPSQIEITMPQEEYDFTLKMLKVEINQPLHDDQFVLSQPPGAEVIHLDRPQSSLVEQVQPGIVVEK